MPRNVGRLRAAGWALLAVLVGSAGLGWYGVKAGLFKVQGPVVQGSVAYERGDWPRAAALARERLAVAPKDTQALRLLARASARLGKDDLAQSLLGRLGPSAWEPEDYAILGGILFRKGRADLAADAWGVALQREPDRPDALAGFVAMDRDKELYSEAATLAERLAARPGWAARANAALGAFRAALGDHGSAELAWSRSLELASKSPEPARPGDLLPLPRPDVVRKGRARSLLHLGRAAEARRVLSDPSVSDADAEAAWLLSRAGLQLGDLAAADAALERSGDYRGDHPGEPEPAPFVGEKRCEKCHPGVSRAAASTRHSRTFPDMNTLNDPASPLPLPRPGTADPFDPKASHTIARVGKKLTFETRAGADTFRAVVDYAFGSDDRGLTMVGRDASGQTRELRLSRFRDDAGRGIWDVTTGHEHHPPQPADLLGRPLSPDAARGCLNCHVTDPHGVATRSGPASLDRAIGCERCHGPGGNHIASVAAKWADPAIAAAPGASDPAEVNRKCGDCHSPHGGVVASPADPSSVRFQATTLGWSRCKTDDGSPLSCLTCHNPHRDADPSPAHYEARCLSCHTPTASASSSAATTVCKVNPKADCLTCHMPVVRTEMIPHTPFTDHHIRVRR